MGKNRLLRIFGLALIVVALLLSVYTVVAYLAWQSGETLRAERAQQEQIDAVATQIGHARTEIESGEYRLALRRLEWVLEQEPEDAEAVSLQATAEASLSRPPTPVPTATSLSNATAATPTGEANDGTRQTAPSGAIARLKALVEEEEWSEAVTAISEFQRDYPDYERQETDELLYQAYIGSGVELLYGEQVELGLYYLAQAEELGDLPQEIRDQQQWAELYLAGIGYYGVNWDVAIFYLRDLCRAAPFYQDSCSLLYDALVALGDQFAFQGEYCPAEGYYREAYDLEESSSLSGKLGQARESCLAATPTPSAPITGTLQITGTAPITGSFPFSQP